MLTPLERKILRDVRDEARGARPEDPVYAAAHDAAVMDLIRRGLVSYNPARPAQKFTLTIRGRYELTLAEYAVTERLTGKAFSPAEVKKLKELGK